ncbi:hypothetical protein MPTK1_4g16030 [Marchantia polymorpha subsp. ruderalis]|uniref:Uncharacterized protein n=2 Tax=Marchantia polymorpha TaxID=3197 RepID=A0A176W0R5_MARPO|nr:hypothetical protein AXG93_2227s1040 [Marchantia polymorpha subsp. ruderalis]PTQ37956.1 hypothetical protein MARPO_0054s0068 [Marchantia polymorpha]BBN08969.1 hypothetical protein Mp_4g16030 [Marchantia polymorpha subsp. ruderalis]|eukprot:PTQ37956.1 hypothetical protein MARPO_0054s0068 [Marchantia polymorpha]
MAAAVQAWNSSNFFPPQSAEVVTVPTEPGVAYLLWGLNSTPSPSLNAQNHDHILLAAKTIVQGGIIAAVSNDRCVFLADADNEEALEQLSRCAGRPSSLVRGAVTLVCAPEWLSEHVDLEEIQKRFGYANLLRFSQDVTSASQDVLGLVLPAGVESGAPAHLLHEGTITSVWKEYQPIRDLSTYVRYFGRRSIMAVSASAVGIDETSDIGSLSEKLKGVVTWVLDDPLNQLTYSEATLVDFTGAKPEVHAAGSKIHADIRVHLSRWGLGDDHA